MKLATGGKFIKLFWASIMPLAGYSGPELKADGGKNYTETSFMKLAAGVNSIKRIFS